MGEKLASPNLTENETPRHDDQAIVAQQKPPSANSVYILIKQALRVDDRALLIDCLYRQDEKLITNSRSVLNPSDVLKLLESLVSIIQLRGAVLACALPWLRSLLLLHAGSTLSCFTALSFIHQLIESRISTFDQAIELSSLFDLLNAETLEDEEEETDVVPPVIYEDDDSSDDDVEADMEVESLEDGREPVIHSDISDDDEEKCEVY